MHKKNPFDPCLYFNISVADRLLTKKWQSQFDQIGLSNTEAYLLFAFWKNQELSQKKLSDILFLNQSTTTRFIDSLVSKNLIIKSGSGKGSNITISKEGIRVAKAVEKSMDDLYQQMNKVVGKKQFKSLISDLNKLRNTLEAEDL